MLQINSPNQSTNLLPELVHLMALGERVALLTLVAIEGSAPYPIGSQMLVRESGEFVGQITGGCAEVALADQAVVALKEARNQTHRYGLDSPFFDIQLPCGSGIDVFFDVSTSLEEYQGILSHLVRRETVKIMLNTSVGIVEKTYLPTERIALFGQGPILTVLAEQARATGFEVAVFVQDQTNVTQLERASIVSSELSNSSNNYTQVFDSYTAVVSLFHEHERETSILKHALNSPCFYIGALGSKNTHQQRLAALQAEGVDAADCARIFGPVGVDVGAETPAQIAISILAQVVAEMPKQRDR